jgi:hypothetical protein
LLCLHVRFRLDSFNRFRVIDETFPGPLQYPGAQTLVLVVDDN